VARCGGELAATGASEVEGFMRPAAIASVVKWAMRAMPEAHWTDTEYNVYFTADDPRRTRLRSTSGGLAHDQIPSDSRFASPTSRTS